MSWIFWVTQANACPENSDLIPISGISRTVLPLIYYEIHKTIQYATVAGFSWLSPILRYALAIEH